MQRITVGSSSLGMKLPCWTFFLLFLMNSPGLKAQGPNQAKPVDARVRTLFKKWEVARSKLDHFDARVLITENSQPSKEITWRRVSVKYLKSDNQSNPVPYFEMRLCQWPEEMPIDYLVCHDFFYVFNHEKEVVKSHEIGALENYLKNLSPVKSLFGKAQDRFRETLPYVILSSNPTALIARYDIRLVKEDEKSAQFDFLPIAESDREIFLKGQLTLSKAQSLPLSIRWEEKNGTKLVYELEQVDLIRAWKPGHFRKPNSFYECTGWTFDGSTQSFPDESKKEDPDKAEAAPFFQKWEEALAKIERMDAMVYAKGETNYDLSVDFPMRIKYQKITKNSKEMKNYDFYFFGSRHEKTSRIIITNDKCYIFKDFEKTIKINEPVSKMASAIKNYNKIDLPFPWLTDMLLFDFKLIALTLTPKEIIERYQVRLTREDKKHIYFEILPFAEKDRKYLRCASIVLDKKTFLLSSVTYEGRSSGSQTLEIKNISLDPKFQPADFEAPTPENWKGWKFPSQEPSKRAIKID